MPLARTNGHRKLSYIVPASPGPVSLFLFSIAVSLPLYQIHAFPPAPSELGRAFPLTFPHVLGTLTLFLILVSASTVSKAEDKAMDSRAKPKPAPVSIRNGPVGDASPHTNGNGKRKSRSSINRVSYRDESDSEDGRLVCFPLFAHLVGKLKSQKNSILTTRLGEASEEGCPGRF